MRRDETVRAGWTTPGAHGSFPAMRTGLAAVAFVGASLSLWVHGRMAAGDETTGESAAEAMYRLGQADEEAGAFAQALMHDRASVAAAPESAWAQRAADRIEWLSAHAEGGFAPLARLEQVRRSPALASDPAAIDALARDADAFPPGRVRVEARMLVAEAWLGRMSVAAEAARMTEAEAAPVARTPERVSDALALLRAVSDDPEADPLTARLAEREIVDALVAQDRLEGASAEATSHANRLDPRFVKQTRTLVRRRAMRHAALFELGVFAAIARAALLRAWFRGALGESGTALRRVAPVAVAFALYLGATGGILASAYETGNAMPFVLFGMSILPLVFIARAWGAVGSGRAAARTGRALLCAVSVFAAAFLLLDVVNPTYLEGFGL
jgi:hypothetical protein